MVNIVPRHILQRGVEVQLCSCCRILLRYLHFLDLDLSVSIVEGIFSTQKDVKERRNGVINVEISTKKLYRGGGAQNRENQEEGKTGESLIDTNQSCFVCPLDFFHNVSQAWATCSHHSPTYLENQRFGLSSSFITFHPTIIAIIFLSLYFKISSYPCLLLGRNHTILQWENENGYSRNNYRKNKCNKNLRWLFTIIYLSIPLFSRKQYEVGEA